jgi:predicted ATPase
VEYIPERVAQTTRRVIHVSGMRGAMGRVYPSAATGETYPGTFDRYVASLIYAWQLEGSVHLGQLNDDLAATGLTWKVHAQRVSDVALELKVGRLKKSVRGGAHDLVSLADVGLGVAQALPILVALRAARPGQLVYVEQPELHLHPNAQVALAGVLAEAVKRSARVVIETHSSLLLLAIQAAIAEKTLTPADVALHWFSRDSRGDSQVDTAVVSRDGSFGTWPADFDDVTLKLQDRFLAAYEKVRRHARQSW